MLKVLQTEHPINGSHLIHCPCKNPWIQNNSEFPYMVGKGCILFDIETNKCKYICRSFQAITGHDDLTGKGIEDFRAFISSNDYTQIVAELVIQYLCVKRNPNPNFSQRPKYFQNIRLLMNNGQFLTLNFGATIIKNPDRNGGHYLTGIFEITHIPENPKITGREMEILQLIANGESSKIVADLLHISETTVITHRKNLMLKLKARNTAEMIKEAVSRSLID